MNAKLMVESVLKAGSLNYNFFLFAKINIGSGVLHPLLMLMIPFYSLTIKFWWLARYAFIISAVGKLFLIRLSGILSN